MIKDPCANKLFSYWVEEHVATKDATTSFLHLKVIVE